MSANTTRLQCSNCWKIAEFQAGCSHPERCGECGMLVGWLPPYFQLKGEHRPDSAKICRKPLPII